MVNTSKDPVTSDILQVLQLRTVNDPWLPRLRIFVLKGATEAFTPVIPLFLSAQTTVIHIIFAKGLPTTVVVSTISWLPKLCPNLEYIGLEKLPRHPVITEAVSEMLLAYNRDTLREFRVDSPLTEEAREIVYRLPKLMVLWMVIQGPTLLPTVILPNLTAIRVECNDDLNWLQGFRGATLEKLEFIVFHTERNDIGDFLEAFERVALTTSIKNTLSGFRFHTSRPWNPNYSSLLSFSQLKELEIHFSCEGGCSSRVDDDIIVSLARAMPKLEVLRLGDIPCNTPTGITVNGLINLACRCPHLLKLRIHFQTTTLVGAATNATAPSPSDKPAVLRKDSALTYLEVGATPIPARSGTMIAHILLQIFPRILNVEYTNREWKPVAETIKDFRQIGGFIHRSSKMHITLNDRW